MSSPPKSATFQASTSYARRSARASRPIGRRHEMSTAKDKLVDKLVAQHPFPVPEAMVDRQIANRADRQLRQLAEQVVDPAKLDLGLVEDP